MKCKIIINHSKPTISKEDIENVVRVLNLGKLTSYEEVSKFEEELSSYIGQRGGIATNSGTNALFLALKSLDVKEGCEVIIPSFLCIAPLNAINYTKAKPRIVDINEDDYNISLKEIKKNVSKKIKAIILPHMFGDPIKNIEEIFSLGVPVIEDCALSVGGSINGKKLGSFSELSIFSFYATKVMTTGHGGMVLSKSKSLLERIKDYMEYDERAEYKESFNFRMTDFQATFGRSQLSRLEDFIEKRRNIAKQYNKEFKAVTSIKIPKRHEESIYFRYIIEVKDADNFIKRIFREGIECKKPVYKPLHHYLGLDKKNFPNTEKAYKECVSVPIYPSMKKHEVGYVIKNILELK